MAACLPHSQGDLSLLSWCQRWDRNLGASLVPCHGGYGSDLRGLVVEEVGPRHKL